MEPGIYTMSNRDLNVKDHSIEKKRKYKREYMREWRKKNKDTQKEYRHKYYADKLSKRADYKESVRKYNAEYRSRPEIVEHKRELARVYWINLSDEKRERLRKRDSELSRERYKANPDKYREYKRIERLQNPGVNYQKVKEWRLENLDKFREQKRRRRARKAGNGPVENIESSKIYNRDNWRCQICHKKVNEKLKWPHPNSASLDHVIPLSKGGSHTKQNVQLTHLKCNASIGDRGIKQLRLFG